MKLELLKNATVVDDAMRFVSQQSNNNDKKLVSKQGENGDTQESKEGESDDSNENIELEGTGEAMTETTTTTINQVF
jgi:hypothetical protein